MLAYHNRKGIKEFYLDRVRAHRCSNDIVQGYGYWDNGRGCAVGCTVHSSDVRAYERELGIPMELARLEDMLFEQLPRECANLWPERFLEAIQPGADLSQVRSQYTHWVRHDPECLEALTFPGIVAIEWATQRFGASAKTNVYIRQSDKLLELLRAA